LFFLAKNFLLKIFSYSQSLIRSYVENILTHEFVQQGLRLRQPQTLLRWVKAYAVAPAADAGYDD
jgi:hypothetical protein